MRDLGVPGGRLIYAAATHVGRVRRRNEDCFVAEPWDDGSALLVAVADGMGGHAGGDVASRIVAGAVGELRHAAFEHDPATRHEALLERFYAADSAIRDRERSDRRLKGMGSTLVMAAATPDMVHYQYAGDSRLYRLDAAGAIRLVTADHSLVQLLAARGEITQEEKSSHPMRAVVTSCLGGGPVGGLSIDPKWDADPAPVFCWNPGDTLLVCSDGLSGMIPDERISGFVRDAGCDVDRLVESLVAAALDAGGDDNITVVVVRNADPADDALPAQAQ